VSVNSQTSTNGRIWQALEPFVRSVVPMVLVWAGMVVLAAAGGYPGVVCITPLAWVLATWTGSQYAQLAAGRRARLPLLGPALAGAALGLCLGIIFMIANEVAFVPGVEAEEAARTRLSGLVMPVVGTPVCAVISTVTAWLTRRRLAPAG
jgi:hypothetical protein